MTDATWALQQARQVGPIAPPKAEAQPIKKLHTGPLHSSVAGRTDHLPSNVPNGSYVLPADIISGLGEGNTMAGFKAAKKMFEGANRQYGGTPYSGANGEYGVGEGLPYMGRAAGGFVTSAPSNKIDLGGGAVRPVTPPTGDVNEVIGSNFNFGRSIGPKTVPMTAINGGVSSDQSETNRVDSLASQMKGDNGYFSRPIVDTDGNVIEGQHRTDALRKLGVTQAPVHVIHDLAKGLSESQLHADVDAAQPMHPDQRHQLISHALNAVYDAKTPAGVRKNYLHPSGYEHGWNAILDSVERQRKHHRGKRATGGYTNNGGGNHVPVAVAGGEHVIAPHEVAWAGNGNMDAGHRALDEFVLRQRRLLIKTLKGLRGPKRGDE